MQISERGPLPLRHEGHAARERSACSWRIVVGIPNLADDDRFLVKE